MDWATNEEWQGSTCRYDNIIYHCCEAWNKHVDQPWHIMTIGRRKWARGFPLLLALDNNVHTVFCVLAKLPRSFARLGQPYFIEKTEPDIASAAIGLDP